MEDNEKLSNIDLAGAFSEAEKIHYKFWKNKNSKLCETLLEEEEGLIGLLFYSQRQVNSLITNSSALNSNNIKWAIKAVESLKNVNGFLKTIYSRLLKTGEQNKAQEIFRYSIGLEGTEIKWAKKKIANYAIEQHKKHGAKYNIPLLVKDKTWRKIEHRIGTKLCFWHIAFMVHPCNAVGAERIRKNIMIDLYDAIESDCLIANRCPPKISKMIDDGQTIDRWEITISDFKKSIELGCMKDYFKSYISVWESFTASDIHTHRFGRLENPEPFLQEGIEMTASAMDAKEFHKELSANIRSQKEQGINNINKAYTDAMKTVERIEGYQIIDSLDEIGRMEFEPVTMPSNFLGKKQRQKTAANRHKKWLEMAIELAENWDSWEQFKIPSCMKNNKQNVCILVADQFCTSLSSVEKAIANPGKPFDLYIKNNGLYGN